MHCTYLPDGRKPLNQSGNPYWRWHRCEVRNPEHGALHMWCHQAVRVGNHAVVLGKNRRQPPVRSASPSQRQKRPSAEVQYGLG